MTYETTLTDKPVNNVILLPYLSTPKKVIAPAAKVTRPPQTFKSKESSFPPRLRLLKIKIPYINSAPTPEIWPTSFYSIVSISSSHFYSSSLKIVMSNMEVEKWCLRASGKSQFSLPANSHATVIDKSRHWTSWNKVLVKCDILTRHC